ncbi:MAG: glycosyltransferase family 2 protein [Bacteroidota bacterium]
MENSLLNPKISIVIVIKNAVNTIENAIKSVLEQDYTNFELVILDGISTDGTLEIIQKYKDRIAFFSSEADSGIYDAMNKAVTNCSGDRIYFLGADDELFDPSVLSHVFNCPHQTNEIIYGNAYYLHRKKIRFGKINKYMLCKQNINHQTIFYPSAVFKEYTYQTKYKILADYLFNIILYFKSDYKFKYLDIVIVKFNDMGTSGLYLDSLFEKNRPQITKEIFPNDVYIFYQARRLFLSIHKLFK